MRPGAGFGVRRKVILAVAVLATAISLLTVPGSLANPVSQPAPALAGSTTPHLAYTDDRDSIVATGDQTGTCVSDKDPTDPNDTPGCDASTLLHEGEMSVTRVPPIEGSTLSYYAAFISTRPERADLGQDPNGQVWIEYPDPDTGRLDPTRVKVVTCLNHGIDSHPVVSPDGAWFAYASNQDGNYRIYVQRVPAWDDLDACDPGVTVNPIEIATDGDNLWPNWLDASTLVYSSTRDDPLGDIYTQSLVVTDPDTGELGPGTVVRITDDPGADTQPAVVQVALGQSPLTWIFFTTTRWRADGSIGVIRADHTESNADGGPVTSLFPIGDSGVPQQSSEFAGLMRSPYTWGLVTTTARDSYGDVRAYQIQMVSSGVEGVDSRPEVVDAGRDEATTQEPGRGESQGTWGYMPTGTNPPLPDYYAVATSHQANVSDVLAGTGTSPRVLAGTAADESTPAYSVTGLVAYSMAVLTPPPTPASGPIPGRAIMVRPADGSGTPVAVDAVRPVRAFDTEPVWSPDGTRIAFTRYTPGTDGQYDSHIYVADVGPNGVATSPPRDVSTYEPTSQYEIVRDEDPTWSADGTSLAITRSISGAADLQVRATLTQSDLLTGADTAGQVGITNTGPSRSGATTVRISVDGSGTLTSTDQTCHANDDGSLTCAVPELELAATHTVNIGLTAGAAVGTGSVSATVTPLPTDDPTNDTDTANFTVAARPDYGFSTTWNIQDGSGPIGSPAVTPNLTVTVHNYGADAQDAGRVNFVLAGPIDPGTTSAVGLPANCVPTPGQSFLIECPVPRLDAGGDYSVTFHVSGTQTSAGDFSDLTHTAHATVTEPGDNNGANNGTGDDSYTLHWFSTGPASEGAVPLDTAMAPNSQDAVPLGAPVKAPQAAEPARAPVRPQTVRAVPDPSPSTVATPQIWVINAQDGTGGPLRQDCQDGDNSGCSPVYGRQPDWSPDGSKIAYVRQDGTGVEFGVAFAQVTIGSTVATENGAAVQVTGLDPENAPTPSRAVISDAEDPDWSPDSTQLAVSGQPNGQPDQRGIYVLDAATGNLVAPTPRIDGQGPQTEPEWEPTSDLSVYIWSTLNYIAVSGPTATDLQPAQQTDVTVTLTNVAGSPAANPVVRTEIPAPLKLVGTPTTNFPGAQCVVQGTAVVLTLNAALPVDSAVTPTCTFTLRGTSTTTDDGTTLTATVTTDTTDPDSPTGPNSATTTIWVTACGYAQDLALGVTPPTEQIAPGGTADYTFTVSNLCQYETPSAHLDITIPADVTVVMPLPSDCGPASGGLACDIPSVPPFGSVDVTITVTSSTPATYPIAGTVSLPNFSEGSGSPSGSPEVSTDNNTASATLVVVVPPSPLPDLDVSFTPTSRSIDVGTLTTYALTVRNLGAGSAAHTMVTIPVPSGVTISPQAPCTVASAMVTCAFGTMSGLASVSNTLTVLGNAPGAYTLNATVTTDTTEASLINNTDSAALTVTRVSEGVDLTVRIGPGFTAAYVGGPKQIQVVVKNNGPSVAQHATLQMVYSAGLGRTAAKACLQGGAACDLGNIAAGAEQRFTITLPFPASSVGSKGIVARVATTVPETDETNNEASLRFRVLQPTLRFLPEVAEPGEVVTLYGEDFPPNTPIKLSYLDGKGILSTPDVITTEADGTYFGPVLILRKDQLGDRTMIGTSTSGVPRYGPAQAHLLVVQRHLALPDLVTRD